MDVSKGYLASLLPKMARHKETRDQTPHEPRRVYFIQLNVARAPMRCDRIQSNPTMSGSMVVFFFDCAIRTTRTQQPQPPSRPVGKDNQWDFGVYRSPPTTCMPRTFSHRTVTNGGTEWLRIFSRRPYSHLSLSTEPITMLHRYRSNQRTDRRGGKNVAKGVHEGASSCS